jgi:hypothetical protein
VLAYAFARHLVGVVMSVLMLVALYFAATSSFVEPLRVRLGNGLVQLGEAIAPEAE